MRPFPRLSGHGWSQVRHSICAMGFYIQVASQDWWRKENTRAARNRASVGAINDALVRDLRAPQWTRTSSSRNLEAFSFHPAYDRGAREDWNGNRERQRRACVQLTNYPDRPSPLSVLRDCFHIRFHIRLHIACAHRVYPIQLPHEPPRHPSRTELGENGAQRNSHSAPARRVLRRRVCASGVSSVRAL